MKELCSLTCLNIDDVMLAVGWLAKENSSFYRKESRFFLCQRRFLSITSASDRTCR
ncbi:winged helix-turn-helix domain-containing protein [Bacteroides fragilis]|nr:winged helix-turn-helix domain-containing protein [Bacteroides fragilis]